MCYFPLCSVTVSDCWHPGGGTDPGELGWLGRLGAAQRAGKKSNECDWLIIRYLATVSVAAIGWQVELEIILREVWSFTITYKVQKSLVVNFRGGSFPALVGWQGRLAAIQWIFCHFHRYISMNAAERKELSTCSRRILIWTPIIKECRWPKILASQFITEDMS